MTVKEFLDLFRKEIINDPEFLERDIVLEVAGCDKYLEISDYLYFRQTPGLVSITHI